MDTSKQVFTLHGVDATGQVVLRRDLTRGRFGVFFAKLAPCEVVLEACGGSRHWGRRPGALGHRVRLIPPQYVKPYVKRGKNDRLDAEAICEAAGRPGMRFVPVKSAERQGRSWCCARASCWWASARSWSTHCAAMLLSSALLPPAA